MKKLFVIPVFFLIMFFIGCQENQITDPVNTADNTSEKIIGGVINLNSPVLDPLSGKCSISGLVKYKIYYPLTPPHALPKSNLAPSAGKLTIFMNAELVELKFTQPHERWLIQGYSEHPVDLIKDELKTIHKKYDITGRDDIALIVTYKFELYSLSIQQMYIKEL